VTAEELSNFAAADDDPLCGIQIGQNPLLRILELIQIFLSARVTTAREPQANQSGEDCIATEIALYWGELDFDIREFRLHGYHASSVCWIEEVRGN
jgi:hypothetical protein